MKHQAASADQADLNNGQAPGAQEGHQRHPQQQQRCEVLTEMQITQRWQGGLSSSTGDDSSEASVLSKGRPPKAPQISCKNSP